MYDLYLNMIKIKATSLWGRVSGDTALLRLPVTDDIMMVIFCALDLSLLDHCMFWAACYLAYFGFLCSAEFIVPNLASLSPSIHLGLADVVHSRFHVVSIMLRASHEGFKKTIHFTRAVFCTLAGVSSHFVQFTLYWLF